MATLPAIPAESSSTAPQPTLFSRILEGTAKVATSWLGLVAGNIAAVAAALVAYRNLPASFQNAPAWQRIAVIAAFPLLAFAFQAVPAAYQEWKKKSISVGGSVQSGYFRLEPRDDEATFTRADGLHHEILRWIERRTDNVVFLTGMSGSGKSSLLNAWIVPNLERQGTIIVRLRGYQDLASALTEELQKPGLIWQRGTQHSGDLHSLLDKACRAVRPRRLLVVIDQFEEFVILQDKARQEPFESLAIALSTDPIPGFSLLLVFRSDYIGLIETSAFPPLLQGQTWKEVPPFTENAAREFMSGSGLRVGPDLLHGVLREAAEIEQTKGLIRPVTINLCGLVISRFASGLPHGFRSGSLIRGFLKESLSLPAARDVAPRILPHMISSHVTKQPRSVGQLAEGSGLPQADVRACLRTLGQNDRAIVRPPSMSVSRLGKYRTIFSFRCSMRS